MMLKAAALLLLCLMAAAFTENGAVNVVDGGMVRDRGETLTHTPATASSETHSSSVYISPGVPSSKTGTDHSLQDSASTRQGSQDCGEGDCRIVTTRVPEKEQPHVVIVKDCENRTPNINKGREGCIEDADVKRDVNVDLLDIVKGSGRKEFKVWWEKATLPDKEGIRCERKEGKCSKRKRREAAEEGTVGEEGGDSEGEDVAEEGEELPDPEALAWIDPGRLASQGVALEHVPSLANLMGLRMVKYKTPQPHPRPFRPPFRPQPPSSSINNNQLANKPTFRFSNGNHLFGNAFHDSFDRYYKSFNRYEGQDVQRSNSHTRGPTEDKSDSLPLESAHSRTSSSYSATSPPRFQNGANRAQPPQPPPANSFSRPPYSGLGNTADSLMQLLNPFNMLGPNQFPQIPRFPYSAAPPNFNPRRPQPFQPLRPTDLLVAEGKDFPQKDIKYEVVMDPNQDTYKGYRYKKDFPLRDDLYVGQDGNIYLKDDDILSPKSPSGRQEFGGHGRPSHGLPLPQDPSPPRPARPHNTQPAPAQEGRFEHDLDNFDQDFNNDYEEVSSYSSLLENHNLDNIIPDDAPPTPHDHNPDQFRNSPPPRPYREQNNFDQRFPYNGRNPLLNNPYVIRTPPNLFPSSGLLSWLFPSYARASYPNYFYNPREVRLPRFRYPSRLWPRQAIPPAVRTPGIPPDANYPQAPNPPAPPRATPPPSRSPAFPASPPFSIRNPSPPRPPTPPASPLRPLRPNPSPPRPSRLPPLSPQPSLHNSSPSRPPLRPTNPQLRNISPGSVGGGRGVPGSGFYPGNGFFHSDFPTVFHMAPSQRRRVMEQLPTPMGQNATAPAEEVSA